MMRQRKSKKEKDTTENIDRWWYILSWPRQEAQLDRNREKDSKREKRKE